MLLRHTTDKVAERSALTINPAKTCQPVGAMYAALGINKCLPHSHGSQGCCAYHRSSLTRHFKDPIMATTSSFTEGASVFGGQANILEAITNIFALYDPEIIAVHTTCLSETIGDDLNQIIKKAYQEGKIPKGKKVFYASTPSFKGSHVTGYSNMTTGMVQYFSENTGKPLKQINLIPSFIEPSDMAEIKRMTSEMGVKFVMFPDTSGVVNSPMDGKFHMYPKGGTTIEQIKSAGDSSFTLALGRVGAMSAAKLLDTKCKVPCEILDLPIGVRGTDNFLDNLRKVAGVHVPDSLMMERGQLVDVMTDMSQYTYNKTAALVGDPDILVSTAEFLVDLGIKILYVVSGTPAGPKFERRIKEIAGEDVKVKTGANADMFYFHQLIKGNKPDLIFGNTYAKYIARDEDIPLIRIGFPIYDRVGHQYMPIMGYKGGLRLLEKILSAVMDRQDRDAPEERYELVM
ncbi:MAG TPA: nitrogenase molybdenum-iron protein subunit beta [Spirochaetota bacterium]|jgi:nitrogenase molybdenum-iron protein beta chain|nr:nitrogenase molybdenum-iron protein subunit beta [Spirochaetota bacterium]HOH36160.1 nitrogenase molybdenum-iron protein subunit beta [Spirochaetota bacterium]HPY02505.1 nitrogenase molybdenum-iron protein subunit beta [Spirochaetota bacterium]HQA52460.1 nitrogenase molybdenum-iron protein subunit beta [Spirochaetota bacterium]